MAFLPQGSSAQVAITAGESIAVGAVRGGTANVTFPVGYPKGPSSTVNNTTAVYGPFATATTVTVYAAQGTAEYVTGTSPVCTDGPVALATDPLTGGNSLVLPGGTLESVGARQPILLGASAGADSGWLPLSKSPERFVYQLDSGTTTTTFSVDISADGSTSLGQAFTGTYASSTVAEITFPIMFSNPLAKFFRWNVVSGGPLSVSRGA